ncbi:hypothetical protein ACOIDH_29800, partial [Klebsiella pneumoniae]|uniref:hypothetical protein n=1 Tax=Klebsiella pneumoniae TaxID=573 RepID=UPI003B5BDD2E
SYSNLRKRAFTAVGRCFGIFEGWTYSEVDACNFSIGMSSPTLALGPIERRIRQRAKWIDLLVFAIHYDAKRDGEIDNGDFIG